MIEAFLDAFTMRGLFGRLRYPGSPAYAIDPRSPNEILEAEPVLHEYMFQEYVKRIQRDSENPSRYAGSSYPRGAERVEHETYHTHG